MHNVATDVVARAVAAAQERAPGLTVSTAIAAAGAAQTLDAESAEAQLLVVGAHGHHGISGSAFGSVTSAVLDRAHCPVMVAPVAVG
jgi:nucleotide-binding universal stress UspA family protein